MWMLNTETLTATKTKQDPPGNKMGSGTQMLFDSLNRKIMLFRTEGAHVYDREKDGWRKVADGDRWFYVYDFDPQHNVFLGSGGTHNMRLVAFRLKNVPIGTKAFFGTKP